MKKYKIAIEGMHCSACAANIERSLKKVSGVKEVSVSLLTKKGFVEAEGSVSKEDIKKAVERTGYKISNIEET